MVYHVEYDGYYRMKWHDDEENALKRWFENFKVDKYAYFAAETEWLVVKEVDSSRGKKRVVCEIGDDGRGTKREVVMDHTTPPAPMTTFAAKRRWEPPPPKSAAEIRREAEWSYMMARGYEPIRRPKYRMTLATLGPMSMSDMMAPIEMEYEIEWVRRRPQEYHVPASYTPPPSKQHRRNV